MASAFRSQLWQGQFAHIYPDPQSGGNMAFPTTSSVDLRSHQLHRKLPSLFSQSSSSFMTGNSAYSLYDYNSLLRPRPTYRVTRRSQPSTAGVVKAAFIFEWIESIIKCITKMPTKLFVQKLEADLDRAAKMVKTGASIVIEVAKEADEFAEEVEKVAERAEEIAEKVSKATDTTEGRVDEILDVLGGNKKVVMTSSYTKVVEDNESQQAAATVAQESTIVSVESSAVHDTSSGPPQ